MRRSRSFSALLVLLVGGVAAAQDDPGPALSERPRTPVVNACVDDTSLIGVAVAAEDSGSATLLVSLQRGSGVPSNARITVTAETRPSYCAAGSRQSVTTDQPFASISGLPMNRVFFVWANYEGCPLPSQFNASANSIAGSPTPLTLQATVTGPNDVTLQFVDPAPYGASVRIGRGTGSDPQTFTYPQDSSPICPIGETFVTVDHPGPGTWSYALFSDGTIGTGYQPSFSNVVTVNVTGGCAVPATPQISTAAFPASARAGSSLLVPWSAVAGATYGLEVSPDAAFGSDVSLIETPRTNALVNIPINPPPGGRVYFRVRAENACGGNEVASPTSNVQSIAVASRPASLLFLKGGLELTATTAVAPPGPVLPSGTLTVRNTGNSSASFSFAATGGFFDVEPKSAVIAAGASATLTVTALAGSTSQPKSVTGTLRGTANGTTVSVSTTVSLTVTSGSVASGSRTGTRFRASKSKLLFSAATGQTPAAQSFDLSLANVVGAGPVSIAASIGPGGSWLTLPSNLATPLASGETRTLTFSVDRAKRSATEARSPWRALLRLSPVGGGADDTLILEVIDLEPPALDAGANLRTGGSAPPAGTSFFIPTVVKGGSATGADLTSDGWLRNDGATDAAVTLFFTPDGKDGVADPSTTRAQTTIPAGATFRLSDLLTSVFKQTGTGQVEVRAQAPNQLTMRSTVESVIGGDGASRFGTELPVAAFGAGVGNDLRALFIPGIREDADNRTNLILSETSGSEATASVSLFDENGLSVGAPLARLVPPFGKVQVNQIVTAIAPNRTLSGGTLKISLSAGLGTIVALATVIDNKSGSFSAVSAFDPRLQQAAAARRNARRTGGSTEALAGLGLVVPSVARVTGANNTQFFTTLSLSNITATAAILQLTYHYIDVNDGNRTKTVTANVTLPPRGALPALQGRDAIASVFHLTNPTYGWISVAGDVERVVATAGVSALVDPKNPAKGLKTAQVNGLFSTSPDFALPGGSDHRFSGVEKSVQRRTNLILVETAGQPCNARLRLFDAAGTPLDERTVPLAANQYFQVNDVLGSFGLGDGPYQNVGVSATALDGACQIVGLATVLDNQSRNPQIFVLQQAGPPAGSSIGF